MAWQANFKAVAICWLGDWGLSSWIQTVLWSEQAQIAFFSELNTIISISHSCLLAIGLHMYCYQASFWYEAKLAALHNKGE